MLKNNPSLTITSLDNFNFEIFAKLKEPIEKFIISFQDIARANFILEKIKPYFDRHQDALKTHNEVFYNEWQNIFIQLQWVVFHTLKEMAILNLMESHFTEMFDIPNYDLYHSFKARMLTKPLNERDNFRAQIRRALLRNRQILTKEGVIVGTREKNGTVANWIGDYNNKVGADIADNIKFVSYLTNSQNTAGLSPASRQRLNILLSFYERLKYSSLTLTGAEETVAFFDVRDNKLKILADGEITEADIQSIEKAEEFMKAGGQEDKFKVQTPPNPILAAFNALPIPLDQIQAKMAELQARMSAQPKILEQILQNPERVREESYVVVALLLWIQNSKFPSISAGRQIPNSKQIQNPNIKIQNEEELKKFVREILENKLGWRAEDSAKIGIRIANILGVKGWAFYDKSKGRFEWEGE